MRRFVPPLIVNPPGRGIRTLGRFSKSVRSVSNQIEPYTNFWDDQNQAAANGDGPLWVVIGDSTAIGIGASAPTKGYVGLVASELDLRVINLAMSGARVRDGLDRQLPVLDDLLASGSIPTHVTMCLGSNDVFWASGSRADVVLRSELAEAIGRLPRRDGIQVAVTPAAGVSNRAKLANRAIRAAASKHDFAVIELWNRGSESPRERIASDRFHPNDLGYRRMAEAIVEEFSSGE